MNERNDEETRKRMMADLEKEFGGGAFAVAVDRLMRAERDIKHYRKMWEDACDALKEVFDRC